MGIKKAVEGINIDIESIADSAIKAVISHLLNVIEWLVAENKQLREENQKLRDENNRLKGKQGKPGIRKEKKAIVQAGLSSTIYQQMDDTGARVNGKNHHTHILCNPFYTAYFTRPGKDRLTIIEILTLGEIFFHFNESSYALMEKMNLPEKRLNILKQRQPKEIMSWEEIDSFLSELFTNPKKHQTLSLLINDYHMLFHYC